tara:strand:- start:748 stop:885 length:138 start_codon:yes stop_codon:yes gene_type:complete
MDGSGNTLSLLKNGSKKIKKSKKSKKILILQAIHSKKYKNPYTIY